MNSNRPSNLLIGVVVGILAVLGLFILGLALGGGDQDGYESDEPSRLENSQESL
ncbi:hypothetical protein PN498_01915 [Oscillatoria sp. CS-180]|uniref:hypothetical protein n=1 Tax=Oscillatoria sp. CS-180 TaxID=3021720 RepID=UPI00233093F8|nr:hypothetical protein [Oscillatoria sp. CS-180]MDB9524732.1 hypothetical protein [Oscillatoria sp. CS-180]